MSTPRPTGTAYAAGDSRNHKDDKDGKKSVFALIGELPNLVTTLIRDEIEQLKRETITRVKTAGIGVGLFVGAAVFAYFALWVFIATAILGIATALPAWLSALIVAVFLLLVAVVLGLLGLARVKRGMPPVPPEALDSVKDDVNAFKGVGHYDR